MIIFALLMPSIVKYPSFEIRSRALVKFISCVITNKFVSMEEHAKNNEKEQVSGRMVNEKALSERKRLSN